MSTQTLTLYAPEVLPWLTVLLELFKKKILLKKERKGVLFGKSREGELESRGGCSMWGFMGCLQCQGLPQKIEQNKEEHPLSMCKVPHSDKLSFVHWDGGRWAGLDPRTFLFRQSRMGPIWREGTDGRGIALKLCKCWATNLCRASPSWPLTGERRGALACFSPWQPSLLHWSSP